RIVVGLLLDPLLVEPPLGHVFDRAFVVAHAALGIEDGARVLADPDDVAVLAIHLRLEAGDLASRRDDPHELLAPAGIDVKLMTDILERRDQLVRRIEAVDPREGRVRIEIAAFRSRAKDAFDRVVEEASIASLGFQQRLLLGLAGRDVLDDAFERREIPIVGEDGGAALPYPAK